jgi:hypothetical protein
LLRINAAEILGTPIDPVSPLAGVLTVQGADIAIDSDEEADWPRPLMFANAERSLTELRRRDGGPP